MIGSRLLILVRKRMAPECHTITSVNLMNSSIFIHKTYEHLTTIYNHPSNGF